MEKSVAVVILNYNGRHFLEQFLPAVTQYSPEADIIVADNASTDDSVSYLKEHFKEIKIILLKKNFGYAGGYNEALKEIGHKYSVLLNSDIEVTKGWITPLLSFMEQNINVAACQPKILSFTQKDHFEHAGASGGYLDKNYYPFCRGRIFNHVEQDKGQYNDTQEIFWASGACMMIRNAHFNEAGGFDSDFFAHMEEIDLSWRWAHMGHTSFIIPESTVYHIGGGTLSYKNPRKTYLNFRNSLYMIYKNCPGSPNKASFKRMLLDAPAAGLFLIKFQWQNFAAVWKAHRSFFKAKKSLAEKRKQITHRPNPSTIKNINILYRYFIRRKKKYSDIFPQE